MFGKATTPLLSQLHNVYLWLDASIVTEFSNGANGIKFIYLRVCSVLVAKALAIRTVQFNVDVCFPSYRTICYRPVRIVFARQTLHKCFAAVGQRIRHASVTPLLVVWSSFISQSTYQFHFIVFFRFLFAKLYKGK